MSDPIVVRREAVFPVSPEAVWALAGAFHALDRWHPAIVTSQNRGDSNGAGAQRVLRLPDGSEVTEELISHDDSGRHYRYRIVSGPLPVGGYEATVTVAAEGAGSRVVWEGRFEPAGASAADAEAAVAGVYESGLQALKALFGDRS